MSLRPQFSLDIAGGHDGRATAHSPQRGGCLHTQFPRLGRHQVSDFVRLEMAPHVFDRVEFRSVSGQALHDDASAGAGEIVPHQGAAMDGRPVPEDQEPAWDVALEVLEDLGVDLLSALRWSLG